MASDSTGDEPVHPGPSKALLRLVKILGAVMGLLFVALIGGIIWKATHKPPPPKPAEISVNLGFDPAKVRQMAIAGNTLAVTTDAEIIVIDISKRIVILRSGKP